MSSTNRGTIRKVNDFYPTPRATIESLLSHHEIKYPVLEPCAGEGAIIRLLKQDEIIFRNDIDMSFDNTYHLDAGKQWSPEWQGIKTVITNPPFNIALSVIQNALEHIDEGTEIIMLLRLNFLGAQNRKPFWDNNPPSKIFILSHRPRFYGGGDSPEYAWFVWKKGYRDTNCQLEII